MLECKHDLIGGADGVRCKKCGLHLSPDEYRKSLKPEPEPKAPPVQKPKAEKKK